MFHSKKGIVEMRIRFLTDIDIRVGVIHNFIDLLTNYTSIHIVDSIDASDVLVNFCVYEKPNIFKEGSRYINFDCDLGNRIDVVNQCNKTLVENINFPGDYMIRLLEGHGNQSQPQRIRSWSEYNDWISSHSDEYIIQEFIDTKNRGYYYSGRIGCAGDTYFPLYSVKCNDWNTNLHAGNIVTFDDSRDCLYLIPNFSSNSNFWEKINNIFKNVLHLDLGFIDFSLHNESIIIWEATTAMVFESPYEFSMTPQKREILNLVTSYLCEA